MAILKPNSYPSSTALTITLASLASTVVDPPAGRESNEVTQSSDLANDVLLHGQITTGTSPTSGKVIQIFVYGTGYDGSTRVRPAGATGADANLTPASFWKDVWFPLVQINTDGTSNKAYTFAGISLLRAFGGLYLPERWGIFVYHSTAVALNATSGNHFIHYTPIQTFVG